MPISIYGAFRSDTTLGNFPATFAPIGFTFEINAYSNLTFNEGADPTVIAGDSITNEVPDDPTQTLNGDAIAWDFTVSVTDGTDTYQIGFLDHDLDGDGGFDFFSSEQGFFLAFVGSVPPLNTTLTIQGIVDNGVALDVDTVVPCFAEGTHIATPHGLVEVQNIQKGDVVLTLDNGVQTVRWIRSRVLSQADLKAKPEARPIRIEVGALGNGLPRAVLRVSPNHRMMLN